MIMNTIYLNMKTNEGVETVDEFTQASDNAPSSNKDFRKYVNEMVSNYHQAGMSVYKSSRCTNDWKQN